jgi:hypothetical protein
LIEAPQRRGERHFFASQPVIGDRDGLLHVALLQLRLKLDRVRRRSLRELPGRGREREFPFRQLSPNAESRWTTAAAPVARRRPLRIAGGDGRQTIRRRAADFSRPN